jgi:hypothetical protein
MNCDGIAAVENQLVWYLLHAERFAIFPGIALSQHTGATGDPPHIQYAAVGGAPLKIWER